MNMLLPPLSYGTPLIDDGGDVGLGIKAVELCRDPDARITLEQSAGLLPAVS
jgi:hypothetical protein